MNRSSARCQGWYTKRRRGRPEIEVRPACGGFGGDSFPLPFLEGTQHQKHYEKEGNKAHDESGNDKRPDRDASGSLYRRRRKRGGRSHDAWGSFERAPLDEKIVENERCCRLVTIVFDEEGVLANWVDARLEDQLPVGGGCFVGYAFQRDGVCISTVDRVGDWCGGVGEFSGIHTVPRQIRTFREKKGKY